MIMRKGGFEWSIANAPALLALGEREQYVPPDDWRKFPWSLVKKLDGGSSRFINSIYCETSKHASGLRFSIHVELYSESHIGASDHPRLRIDLVRHILGAIKGEARRQFLALLRREVEACAAFAAELRKSAERRQAIVDKLTVLIT